MSPTEGSGPDVPGPGESAAASPGDESLTGLVGSVIAGRYRLLRLLGEGAMGAVYLGEHLKIGRKDAIKVLRGGHAADAESIARFNRGARNLSAIRHPNVCTLYDYGETEDGSPFLAIEYITGETLKDLLDREGALEPARALDIGLQTAQALAAAHDAGIVHRDLKPGNIMLERGRGGRDVVKVVDFDIAKGPEPPTGEELTRLGWVVGTPEYMSPEQLTGERLDGRSDVFSLGMVLFRMLSGSLPFRDTDVQRIMIERLTGTPLTLAEANPDRNVPAGLQELLDRALARDRTQRYATAEEFAGALTAAIERAAAGAAGEAVPGEFLPETRVAPPPVQVATGAAEPAPDHDGASESWLTRSRLLIAAFVVIAGAAVTTAIALGGPGGDENGGTGGQQGQESTIRLDSSGTGGGDDVQGGGGEDPGQDPEGGGGESVRGGGDSRGSRGGGTEPPDSNEVEPPAVETRLVPARARDLLAEQNRLLAIDPDAYGVTSDRARASAIRDTAAAVYAMPAVSDALRGLAARIAGFASLALRDATECERWFTLAADLRPDDDVTRMQLQNCERIRE